MNVARVFVLALAGLCVFGRQSSVARPPLAHPAPIESSYVRLNDWARANHFELHWSRAGDSVQLSNHNWRMVFPKDSREAELGDVHVCLSYPVLFRNGTAWISQMDLETALHPLLYPAKNPKGARIRNIVIDPGHGGKDPGNIVGSQQEKKYTLLLAQELAAQLRSAGFSPSLTRSTDIFVPLPDRAEIARRRGADLFVSVHWNELPGNRSMKGAQTFCLTPAGASSSNAGGHSGIGPGASPGNRNDAKNVLLAYSVQSSLLGSVRMEDRGVRRARYWILRDATMPAILIEGGFMSNPSEAQRIYDAGYRRQMARAIVQGVLEYQRELQN
jgi:N-acetylmuramoyl-L-alanine amidase